jgi:pyruvate/2-oxoglutarate dehydrogenase complex dihydrolipoamide acyltransferase (E2) component
MKNYLTITTLAATAALFTLSAQAQTQPLTRADVNAQLEQARSSGALERMASEGFGLPTPVMRSAAPVEAPPAAAVQPEAPKAQGLTRAEVRAELARARAAGEMDFAAAEVNGTSPYAPRSVAAPVYAGKDGTDRFARSNAR